ncbi:MAG: glycoside hydrolase family 11 protein, partial [Oscillospiraceae bacterium]|nr:glycoside hydrolase family 11 protein [Oscillospiraceae bacterium]
MIIFKRTLTVLICFLLIASVLCGCQGEQKILHDFEIGEEDGYGYELWKDHGDTTMTLTGGGTFSCEWSNINNALFRRGKKFDCTQTWREIGNIKVEYEVDYQPDGNSYF